MIEVEWDRESTGSFIAAVELKALDRTRLGVDVWKVISDNHLNILRSETLTGADRVSRMRFEFELADPAHLDSLLERPQAHRQRLRRLPGAAQPRVIRRSRGAWWRSGGR